MYKFLMYTLLQNNFTVLSTETIAEIGATITAHNEQFFKDHKVGALKLNTFFLDKQFQIKQRGDNTCMVDFKSICERLYKIYKSYDFIWCNQSYTSLASSLFKHMRGYLPESQYDTKTREVLDDFYPRVLQWCSTDPAPDNLVSLDISKCYPSILIDNETPIPLYSIHDII